MYDAQGKNVAFVLGVFFGCIYKDLQFDKWGNSRTIYKVFNHYSDIIEFNFSAEILAKILQDQQICDGEIIAFKAKRSWDRIVIKSAFVLDKSQLVEGQYKELIKFIDWYSVNPKYWRKPASLSGKVPKEVIKKYINRRIEIALQESKVDRTALVYSEALKRQILNCKILGIFDVNSVPDCLLKTLQTHIFLKKFVENSEREELAIELIQFWKQLFPNEPWTVEALYTPAYRLQKWLESPQEPRPDVEIQAWAAVFEQAGPAGQSVVIKQLPAGQFPAFLTALTSLEHQQTAQGWWFDRQLDAWPALVFDLETDRQTIRELAWCSGWWLTQERKQPGEAEFQEFSEAARTASLLVGHNVLAFDLPELQRQAGLDLPTEAVWDTLRVEALLRPSAPTLALRTAHVARADAELTRRLFRSQVARLFKQYPYLSEGMNAHLPPAARPWLADLRAGLHDYPFAEETDEAVVDSFFQPTTQFPALPLGTPPLLLAPPPLWPLVLAAEPATVVLSRHDAPETCLLSPEKIRSAFGPEAYLRVALEAFVHDAEQRGEPPALHRLTPWLRVQLEQVLDPAQVCVRTWEAVSVHDGHPRYLTTPDEYARHPERFGELEACLVEPELARLHDRVPVGELPVSTLATRLARHPVLLRFQGGQSFVPVERGALAEAGLTGLPEHLTRFFLEKGDFLTLRVWGAPELPKLAAARLLPPASKFTRESLALVRVREGAPDAVASRLNPETPYRDHYWAYLSLLADALADHAAPLLLLARRPDDVKAATALFEAAGYYVPSAEASLRRRLQLLHDSTRPRRLLVVAADEAHRVAAANPGQPLRVLLEGFNLSEIRILTEEKPLQQRDFDERPATTPEEAADEGENEVPTGEPGADEAETGGTESEYPEAEAVPDPNEPGAEAENEEEDEEEPETGEQTEPEKKKSDPLTLSDLFDRAEPLVRSLRHLLAGNHDGHRLYVLDSRLGDVPGLARRWNARTEVFDPPRDESFKTRWAEARHWFPSPDRRADVEVNLDDLRAVIETVFIDGNSLSPEQQAYLPLVASRRDDVAVSLPTGGGKSVLFQGPALYRGCLTNRLSLVVTPLKALMEEQKGKMQALGFYTCVECINQNTDSPDDVYRRLAGGELTLLYVTPERFRSRRFVKALESRLAKDQTLEYVIFDEAHCISQWGHEFRPDYLHSALVLNGRRKINGATYPVLLFSATISDQIFNDFTAIFQ